MLAVLLMLVLGVPLAGQVPTSNAWVTIETPPGVAIMGFRPRSAPYSAEVKPLVFEHFSQGQPPSDEKGRVISGAAFYGWETNGRVHVVVLKLVPDADAENRFYPDADDRRLHYEEVSRFEMQPGEVRQTEELTQLFRGRVTAVRVETKAH